MLRGCRSEFEIAQRVALPPIELGDLLRGNSKLLEVRSHAERRDERGATLRELDHRGLAQVVVVIVRDQHRVERRQLRHRHGRRMKSLGPRKRHRPETIAEHGIRDHALAVDLEQHRRVSEPRDAQPRRTDGLGPRLERSLDGNHPGRFALFPTEEELAHDRQLPTLDARADRGGVVERTIAILLRRACALQPESTETHA
jgi:hypothetical protein